MADIQFGDELEHVITRDEWPLEKALEYLRDETIAIIGYGVQGPGQALNLKDNGFNVIVGQRRGGKTWDKAVSDGWVEGETLFDIEEAVKRGTIIQYLLSDAGQIAQWDAVKKHLNPGSVFISHTVSQSPSAKILVSFHQRESMWCWWHQKALELLYADSFLKAKDLTQVTQFTRMLPAELRNGLCLSESE